MILKIIIKRKKTNNIIAAWIKKDKIFEKDLLQLFHFFKENIQVSSKRRFHKYYMITSKNPAIMISFISALNELIPETYFNLDNYIQEELLDIGNV
ncbi:MAG: hypothetical protein EU539_04140 [Promethearchaeota archaeon]|nr:MAG: hypothetical protein EU539_04140 [Candidatus Lokiarchaeota archaeon]